ncbi:Oxoglutarate/iron-dependent dioxygenase [Trema orientale]|uniref:Oxoglutarate/iron-dependent dioxygenase n=1 Tax=Trema orientale TaxID=63057 RepID=A0A2P5FRL6_TREOI|nr:Oxoglutarate/iron-dependent dioxygenase [Trema orientale]
MDFDPPFQETYKALLPNSISSTTTNDNKLFVVEEYELPLIDLSHLMSPHQKEKEMCIQNIVDAASNWGFFEVENHGIPEEVLKSMSYEQKKVFHQPFQDKSQTNVLNSSPNCYRWGNPKATCLNQLSWSEAFHISVTDILGMTNNEYKSLRLAMEKFAKRAFGLAKNLAHILAENLGLKSTYFQENCPPNSSYLRLNRYPPCPYSSKLQMFGLVPHTDSDFLSVVYQDQVGGLQLFKDGRWVAVKPNPEALVINIGDLFQALSNGVYKSIRHRVVASNSEKERFSAAYFYCPISDAIIESCSHGQSTVAVYRNFTFREYKRQIQKDVQDTGDKVGLQRFLLSY